MAVAVQDILEVLREKGINPEEDTVNFDLPGIGDVQEGETIYTTSVAKVFEERGEDYPETAAPIDDRRFRAFVEEIHRISETEMPWWIQGGKSEPPEPHCAWYCPIHFFGHSWGIFLREHCILQYATEIARRVKWRSIPRPIPLTVPRQLLRSAFYALYLHEQFHHKVESLGFRLLIATGTDRYRPYKANVYRRSFLTPHCLEESLANADSYRRLNEERYGKKLDNPIRDALRNFLRASFRTQPPGYAEAARFLDERRYRAGLYELQSQILDGRRPPTTPSYHWAIAPNVITSLMDISDEIYVILPVGGRPLFRPTSIDPGYTASTRALVGALTRHYGYTLVQGGKGSHMKLTKPGAPNIHVPGNRPVLSPGVMRQALQALGGYPLSALPDMLRGALNGIPEHRHKELEELF